MSMLTRKSGRSNGAMTTVADLINRLAVPAERILLSPPPGTATEQDLLQSPRLCELVDGILVEKAMGFYESRLAAALIYFLEHYLTTHPLGFVLDGSGMCRVDPSQVRLPDVSFYSWDHFPGKLLPADEQILNLVPDLAVEVLSPGNTVAEMERKRKEYFAGGTKLYWEADPATRTVSVYTSFKRHKVVDESGTLTGGAVLPGFELSVREWFEKAGKRG